jgi:acetylornithine deacetylase/succinyl-diaminopimelate desuccinylase-like protein
VPNQEPETIKKALVQAIEDRCPRGVTLKIKTSHGGVPYLVVPPGRSNTPSDQNPVLNRAFQAAEEAIGRSFGNPPLYLREGGSVPIIADIKRIWNLDSLMIGLFLPEDNLHAPDESFNLAVMERGIEAVYSLLAAVASGEDR